MCRRSNMKLSRRGQLPVHGPGGVPNHARTGEVLEKVSPMSRECTARGREPGIGPTKVGRGGEDAPQQDLVTIGKAEEWWWRSQGPPDRAPENWVGIGGSLTSPTSPSGLASRPAGITLPCKSWKNSRPTTESVQAFGRNSCFGCIPDLFPGNPREHHVKKPYEPKRLVGSQMNQ
jgi:hypothetical protein